jgi:hypothetical protein
MDWENLLDPLEFEYYLSIYNQVYFVSTIKGAAL